MYEIGLGVLLFTTIVLTLVAVVLLVRTRLVVSGDVDLVINDKQTITTSVGTKLLEALEQGGIYLPSGCGGKGTCGQCRVVVLSGGGAILPIELAQVMKREARAGTRLACQVPIKQNMTVRVPDEAFGVEQWQCIVRSNDNVSTMIKELVLELPAGEEITFRAGSYIQITVPPYETVFTDFDIGEIYRDEYRQRSSRSHSSR